jgi:hypothetical protein
MQCRKDDPRIASAFYDLLVSLHLVRSIGNGDPPACSEIDDGSSRNGDVQSLVKKALNGTSDARSLNKDSSIFVQSTKILSTREYSLMFDASDGTDPMIGFILGAALWWHLAEPGWKDQDYAELSRSPLSIPARRVAIALRYLQSAVYAGHEAGYLELYKCHAFLARDFQKHARWT